MPDLAVLIAMVVEYTGENYRQFSLLTWNPFIDHFVHPVKGMDEGIIILAGCVFHMKICRKIKVKIYIH